MASPLWWTSAVQVGSHEYAKAFAGAGWDVAYLSDPLTPFHLALGPGRIRERLAIYSRGGLRDPRSNVFAYVPGALLTPRMPMPPGLGGISRNWNRLTFPDPVRLLAKQGFDAVDVLWFDSLISGFLLDRLGPKRSVLRYADHTLGFPGHRPVVSAMERELASRVDLVTYASRSLEPYVEALRPRAMLHVPNGVTLAEFSGPVPEIPDDLAPIPRPRAVYVGALQDWFDFRLVNHLVQRLPDVSFVLIGPSSLARRKLEARPNLHILGQRDPATVPAYLRHSDVGLIPNAMPRNRQFVGSMQPLKLYQYLASGLPVVAAWSPELEAMDSPAWLYRSTDEARRLLEAALRDSPPAEHLTAWVQGMDWSMRLRRVLDALGLPADEAVAT
jgi:glycosyltransferase involved in cell wall biosynthesis